MPMNNLIKDSSNYSETTGSLWFYSKDKTTSFNANIANNNIESFEYKVKLLESPETDEANGILNNATIAVSLKYWSNFWRSLEMPFLNCEVELKLKSTKYYVLCAAGGENANDNSDDIIYSITRSFNKFVNKEIFLLCRWFLKVKPKY